MKQTIFTCFILLTALLAGCSEEIEPSFSFESEETTLLLDPEKGSSATLHFSSAREWQATTTADWLEISQVSGEAGSFNLTLTALSANDSTDTRRATLRLTSASLTQDISVGQEPGDYVDPEQDSYSIGAEGGELAIHFTTNVDDEDLHIYSSGVSWITQDDSASTKATKAAYVVNLTILPNEDPLSRTAFLLFYKRENRRETFLNAVSINQEGSSAGSSSDYSADKTVRRLQAATQGNGIPIVLMGDGFIDTEIADGTYGRVMEQSMENLFSEEPMQSLRSYFDVYEVTAVSKHNNFGRGYETALSCWIEGGLSTGVGGDNDAVEAYAECVEGIDLSETTAVVILNSTFYAGTTYFGFTDGSKVSEFAIAYCPTIYGMESEEFRQVLTHEAVGHGFAKLDDEYSYERMGTIPASEIEEVRKRQELGWAQNVDFTEDTGTVLWARFLADSRYADEGLGIYEGACTYMYGAYRPSEESMMRSNTSGFNAPSRKAIYDAVMLRGTGQQTDYESFAAFDLPLRASLRSHAARAATPAGRKPFARPRFTGEPLRSR